MTQNLQKPTNPTAVKLLQIIVKFYRTIHNVKICNGFKLYEESSVSDFFSNYKLRHRKILKVTGHSLSDNIAAESNSIFFVKARSNYQLGA